MDGKVVDYAVFEGTQIRHERTVKRLIIALVLTIILIFASNAIWLYAWMQYDYTSEQSISVGQDATDGGDVHYIGDINNGSPKNSNKE